jgi:hypothetical protein
MLIYFSTIECETYHIGLLPTVLVFVAGAYSLTQPAPPILHFFVGTITAWHITKVLFIHGCTI